VLEVTNLKLLLADTQGRTPSGTTGSWQQFWLSRTAIKPQRPEVV